MRPVVGSISTSATWTPLGKDGAASNELFASRLSPSCLVLSEFALVPIVAGNASPEAAAALLDAVWAGPETLIVVSTDLSHYLDYRSCQETDRQTADAIERFNSSALGPKSACGRVQCAARSPPRGVAA